MRGQRCYYSEAHVRSLLKCGTLKLPVPRSYYCSTLTHAGALFLSPAPPCVRELSFGANHIASGSLALKPQR
jgi:hypothetical protein